MNWKVFRMRVSNLRYETLRCATPSHSLKLGRVRITEQFMLLGIEFDVIKTCQSGFSPI